MPHHGPPLAAARRAVWDKEEGAYQVSHECDRCQTQRKAWWRTIGLRWIPPEGRAEQQDSGLETTAARAAFAGSPRQRQVLLGQRPQQDNGHDQHDDHEDCRSQIGHVTHLLSCFSQERDLRDI